MGSVTWPQVPGKRPQNCKLGPKFNAIFMKKHQMFVAALLSSALLPQISQAQVMAPAAPVAANMSEADIKALGEGIAFPYEKLDSVLRETVDKEGNVFYSKIKGRNDLETFVRAVAIADLTKFPKWMVPSDPKDPKSKEKPDQFPELAFYINAYNGLFLKAVGDEYPIRSLGDIKGLDTEKTRVVAGQSYSFADLRRKIAEIDPRALFCLPDGTNAGPRASSGVFRYTGLDQQLNAAISSFVNDVTRVTPPVRLENKVSVSPWMQTVDEYFGTKGGRSKWNGIKSLLVSYTTRNSDQGYLSAGDYQVAFLPADKSVNEARTRP
ncbi:DUF547 domain-containing protein [bacterium]|nr:MAG: DUF547 domain-containing protein [bacterium]